MPHNHPPRCCCELPPGGEPGKRTPCPSCVEHGELANPECSSCHTEWGRPHTDYCKAVDPAEYPGQPDRCTYPVDTSTGGGAHPELGTIKLPDTVHVTVGCVFTHDHGPHTGCPGVPDWPAIRAKVAVPRAMVEGDHQPPAIAVATNDLEQSTKAAHGVSHQPGPWCPNPCAYHGSPDR